MSRIGNNPIVVPEGVNVEIHPDSVKVSGKLGTLSQNFDGVSVSKEENQLIVKRNSESKEHKAKHGLYRSLIYNMVVGVSQGWKKKFRTCWCWLQSAKLWTKTRLVTWVFSQHSYDAS